MKLDVDFHRFGKAFNDCGRGNQFSYDGLKALYEYIINFEEETGEEIVLDVIGLCCEYTEYDHFKIFQSEHTHMGYKSLEDVSNDTTVIPIDEESFIVGNF
tara:strand:+ start:1135 stop:1437 length:303 start_codon:yes stop_codon:yes gene_type:complete